MRLKPLMGLLPAGATIERRFPPLPDDITAFPQLRGGVKVVDQNRESITLSNPSPLPGGYMVLFLNERQRVAVTLAAGAGVSAVNMIANLAQLVREGRKP